MFTHGGTSKNTPCSLAFIPVSTETSAFQSLQGTNPGPLPARNAPTWDVSPRTKGATPWWISHRDLLRPARGTLRRLFNGLSQ
ncbi:hypothetical protein AVEN_198310-1 [Araneus ventricosus]|uniref:Uncharacterized protein n=1 Tax=Araneus ventricosus TaxID=182803 RepID=A0A4Y2RKM3_ARAVE|nr:hypothetical protein AVEN_198310-1 [Araneus ventricosus]